jgi:hypothetical protein
MRVVFQLLAVFLLVLGAPAAASAQLRISDLDVFLNDHEITVHVVVLGALPVRFHEGLESGVPAHVRFTVELWQYNRLWPNRLVAAKTIERALEYNVVTKEYKVASVRGETRGAYATRDLRDAQRVISELRSLKLGPASQVDAAEIFFVRVFAETALRGENTFVTRMAGTAEQVERRSDYRTIQRAE